MSYMSCYVLLGEEHAMPTYGTTDRVRQQAAKEYIEPARRAGVKHVHHTGTGGDQSFAVLAKGEHRPLTNVENNETNTN